MEIFNEERLQTEQKFTIKSQAAVNIVRYLTKGEALVNHENNEERSSEQMSGEEAAEYLSEVLDTESTSNYEGNLPNPDLLDEHWDQLLSNGDLARVAPTEATVYFDEQDASPEEKTGMAYILETPVEDKNGDVGTVRISSARTIGQPSHPKDLEELESRVYGEAAEALQAVYENIDY